MRARDRRCRERGSSCAGNLAAQPGAGRVVRPYMRRVVLALAAQLAAAGSAHAQPAAWGAQRAPFDADTARRWQAVLAKNPWDEGALAQLRAMYQRYKSLAALEATYAGATDAASLIVLARLAPADLGRWQRVIEVAEDGRSLVALADIELTLGRADAA